MRRATNSLGDTGTSKPSAATKRCHSAWRQRWLSWLLMAVMDGYIAMVLMCSGYDNGHTSGHLAGIDNNGYNMLQRCLTMISKVK